MTIRNLTAEHDWIFGNGQSDYLTGDREILLNIKTRLLSFKNNCFFALNEGIDWWTRLDSTQQERLENDIQQVIITTPGVASVEAIDVYLNAERMLMCSYSITTQNDNVLTNTLQLPIV